MHAIRRPHRPRHAFATVVCLVATLAALALTATAPAQGRELTLSWEDTFPTYRLRPNVPVTVNIAEGLWLPDDTDIEVKHDPKLRVRQDAFKLTFTYTGGLPDGFVFVPVKATTGGAYAQIELVFDISNTEPKEFSYKGEPGKTVHVAGSFNGWSSTASPLKDDDGDGTYTGSFDVSPGSHQYKLVVDGEWMADPANPRREEGGHGNSLLEVGSGAPGLAPLYFVQDLAKDLRTSPRSAVIEGYLVAGGSILTGIEGGTLVVLSGNRRHPADFVPEKGRIRIRLRDFDASWRLFLTGKRPTTTGRSGTPFHQEFRVVFPSTARDGVWRDSMIYFAMTDRFADGDPANNKPVEDPDVAPLANWMGGDFQGIAKKLTEEGYFEKLGVNTLWVSPPFRNAEGAWTDSLPPNLKFTGYHGYWPVDPRRIEPRFGGETALKRLVDEAHAKKMRVLVDFVSNHVHVDHPWYKEHPEWFGTIELEGGKQNLRLFDDYPFTTWFDTFLPSFDYPANPDAIRASVDQALYLIDEYGIDGFRHDAVKHVPPAYWRDLTRRIVFFHEVPKKKRYYQVGETISGRDTINSFVGPGMLDAQFDFPLTWAIRDAFAFGNVPMASLDRAVRESLAAYGEDHLMVNFVGNHDFSRFTAFADGDVAADADEKAIGREKQVAVDDPATYAKLELAMAFVMTAPGLPMIYYGDEFGMSGAGDPDNRRKMRFGAELSAAEQAQLKKTQALGRLRRENRVFWTGSYLPLDAADDTLVFLRSDFDMKAVVMLNRADRDRIVELAVPGLDKGMRFQLAYSSAPPSGRGEGAVQTFLPLSERARPVTLPARSVLIYTAANPNPLHQWN